MAFKKTASTTYGIDVADAYHRVEDVKIVSKTVITYAVRAYKDNTGVAFFDEKHMISGYDIAGKNPIAQAYAHLKTLPEFTDAVDC